MGSRGRSPLGPTVGKFPRSHKFTLGDRIESVALGVLEALIDATYTKERNEHLRAKNEGFPDFFAVRESAAGP